MAMARIYDNVIDSICFRDVCRISLTIYTRAHQATSRNHINVSHSTEYKVAANNKSNEASSKEEIFEIFSFHSDQPFINALYDPYPAIITDIMFRNHNVVNK